MLWSPLRLTQKRWKALYIAGFLLVGMILGFGLTRLDTDVLTALITSSVLLGGVLGGARIFRGRNELLLAPRPWWRMTAKPLAGFVLGAWWAMGALNSILLLWAGRSAAVSIIDGVPVLLLAVLYFASSIRLLRQVNRPSHKAVMDHSAQ